LAKEHGDPCRCSYLRSDQRSITPLRMLNGVEVLEVQTLVYRPETGSCGNLKGKVETRFKKKEFLEPSAKS